MKLGSLVSKAIFPGAEMLKIPAGVWSDLVVQLEVDAPRLVCQEISKRPRHLHEACGEEKKNRIERQEA